MVCGRLNSMLQLPLRCNRQVGLTEKKIDYWLWGKRKAVRKEGWEGADPSKKTKKQKRAK